MIKAKEIRSYGLCSIQMFVYPADTSATGKRMIMFEIIDEDTYDLIAAFPTRQRAKKFAHRYTADPDGTMQRQRMLSGDRLTHVRTLWVLSSLSTWIDYELVITDKHNSKAELERYKASEIYLTRAENEIMVRYYLNDEIEARFMYISGIKTVRAIAENTFAFETYTGKVYTISGKD